MTNPFKVQMNKVRNNTAINTNEDNYTKVTTTGTQKTPVVSPLLARKKKDIKQIYSVKLERELSDKMITLSLQQNLPFTNIIEYGLEKVFEELDVEIDKELVKKYYATRGKKNE